MKIVSEEQYSPEWWEARRGLPTASNFKKIVTAVKGDYSKQAVDYACELVSQMYDPSYGEIDDYKSAAMKNGTLLEPEARAFYEFDRGMDVTQVGLCVTEDGRFGTSPDGLIGDEGALEVKSVIGPTQVKYLSAGTLPNEHKAQCHGHLYVTGREWCDFFSYSPGLPPLLLRVTPDAFTHRLGECLERFHAELSAVKEQVAKFADPPDFSIPEPVEDHLF